MKTNILTCLSILTFFNHSKSLAQLHQVRFEHVSREKGLSHSSTDQIVQDSLGFLWISSHDGLNKFDCYNFQVFRSESNNPNSLHSSIISLLFKDKRNLLWISFYYGVLNLLDPKKERFTFFENQPETNTSLSNNKVNVFYNSSDGKMWIGTEKGLNLYDYSSQKFKCFLFDSLDRNTLPSNRITSLFEDQLYIFSDGYADRLGGDQGAEKFLYPGFQELLTNAGAHPPQKQLEILNENLKKWRGDVDQLDDVLVIGFKI